MITAAPLVKVTKTYKEDYSALKGAKFGYAKDPSFIVDELECGHVHTRDLGTKSAKRRRCWTCASRRLHRV